MIIPTFTLPFLSRLVLESCRPLGVHMIVDRGARVADGVRVGTRFVAADESDAHPEYAARLISARAEDTVYTEAFSTNWPNAPHRCLRSSVAAAAASPGEVVGETPNLNGTRDVVSLGPGAGRDQPLQFGALVVR
jgi:hypothetical protein